MRASEPLVCPACATPHPLEERFCRDCGMPLVYSGVIGGGDVAVTARQERARKIKPQLSEGELTKVAAGRNQAEAELIQGLLLAEGVPSMLRRSAGFDVPDFLAAGPRDILVPSSGLDAAREILGDPQTPRRLPEQPHPAWMRALAVTLFVCVLAAFAAGVALPFFD
jgi:hypothetical protein